MKQRIQCLLLVCTVLAGCGAPALPTSVPAATLPPAAATAAPALRADGLTDDEAATLGSLKMIDDYPLYTMHYRGAFPQRRANLKDDARAAADAPALPRAWACSLFAALGDPNSQLYGRNFDWEYSPAVLLFAAPPNGYASVSTVDIAYLGFGAGRATGIEKLPLAERRALLNTPFLPFDGMNERGLVVAMAAVSPGGMTPEPNKESVTSLEVIRRMLDTAATVDEAVAVLQRYNVDMGGGPPLHYLIADRAGRAALVEFHQGRLVVLPSPHPWHQATNFIRSAAAGDPQGLCWRYDKLTKQLEAVQGRLAVSGAMELLKEVAQATTQWSVVYGINSGTVDVAMGKHYDRVHHLVLDR